MWGAEVLGFGVGLVRSAGFAGSFSGVGVGGVPYFCVSLFLDLRGAEWGGVR
jgi:hypothetical protein